MMLRRSGLGAVLAAALAAVGVAACGNTDNDNSSASGAKASGPCATTAGVKDDSITIGHLMGLTGPQEAVAPAFLAGFDAYVKSINDDGGIDGRKLVIKRVDNGFDAQKSVKEFASVAPESAMVLVHGSAAINALLPQVEKTCVPTEALAQAGTNAVQSHVFLPGTPYAYAAINGMDWVEREQKKGAKWGIIYQDDPLGQEILKATRFGAKEIGVDLAAEAAFEYPGDTDFSAQVKKMKDAGVDWIMMAALPPSSIKIVGTAVAAGLPNVKWLNPQVGWAGELTFPTPALDVFAGRVYSSMYLSGWDSSDAAGLQEAKDFIKSVNPKATGQLPLFGYVWAKVMTDVLKRALEDGDMSRAGINKAVSELGSVDNKGLLCDYSFGESGQPGNPSRATLIMETSKDAAPDGYKQVAGCFTSEAAKAFDLESLTK
jgi:ABC-type branched-subunit amino acid transport system substrate-binding protein